MKDALWYCGFYFTDNGWTLARYLVDNDRSAAECRKLIDLDPFGPALWERRVGCIFSFAEISHDPTVCRIMLPSEFAISCVIETMGQEYDKDDAQYVQEKDCPGIKGLSLKQDRCSVFKALRYHDANDCDPIDNAVLRAGCRVEMQAWWQYPELRTSDYFGHYRDTR